VDRPYEFVKESMVWRRPRTPVVVFRRLIGFQRQGTALPSFCSTLLEENVGQDAQGDFDLRWTANSMYGGTWTGPLDPRTTELILIVCDAPS